MKKVKIAILIAFISLLFVACQKELTMDSSLGLAGGSTANLKGNWKFIGMYSKTEAIIELSDGIDILKTITRSEYYTRNNTGTLEIDGSKMISNNFGFEVDTVATGLIYENNVLIDSVIAPFNFVLPPANSVSPYTQVTADSIYFTGGQFSSIGGTTPLNKPTGVKLKVQGDKLSMTINLSITDLQTSMGITQSKKEKVSTVLTYQKQ